MPVALRLDSVSFSYRDSVPILIDVHCELHAGWTALVAPNGTGKTTLLRLIAGELEPEAGAIVAEPRGASVAWCRQSAARLTDEIRRFSELPDGEARRWMGRLELDPADLERWPTLSPGERRRWQIGAALAAAPDVLLLDEPTDHLDGDARRLLVGVLRRFEGVGVLVSHDRTLLAALSTATARIHAAGVELRRCGFEEATTAWRDENEARRQAREKIRREERRLRKRLGQRQNDLRSADASVGRRKRSKGRKDSDSRTMAASIRAAKGAARLSREAAIVRDQVARTEDALEAVRFDKVRGGPVRLAFNPAERPTLASLHLPSLDAGGQVLIRDVGMEIRRDSRLWIAGPNGAGKTTLLRALHGASTLPDDRVLHLPQELQPDAIAGLLREVRDAPAEQRGRLLAITSTLGADPDRLLETDEPSPGEARKLWIAAGLARGVAACFLDEPTNHLDLPAIERLEAALVDYPGAIVLVSHDPALAASCTNETWTIAAGEITRT
jgi:ATPase subunit of ABC transporter with duplicated ATPase domains